MGYTFFKYHLPSQAAKLRLKGKRTQNDKEWILILGTKLRYIVSSNELHLQPTTIESRIFTEKDVWKTCLKSTQVWMD